MATRIDPVVRAIDMLGGPTKAAARLAISVQSLYFYQRGRVQIPPLVCIDIEDFTAGAVRVEELRPDIRWHIIRRRAARGNNGRKPQ